MQQIQKGFEKYGLKNSERGVFVVILNAPKGKKVELLNQIREICPEQFEDISRHVEFQDMDAIIQQFEIKEIEKSFENESDNLNPEKEQLENAEKIYEYSSGVLVIGAPGTGKTTFCNALQQLFTQLERKHEIINLDPANDNMDYQCGIDIHELITQEDVMEQFQLGPNGSMIYCMEFLETNIDWLIQKIQESKKRYFIFDLPGQVEIYSNHQSLKNIIQILSKRLNLHISAIHLVDCTYLYDKNRFLASMMLSLTAIIGMEMPFINAITKVDLMKNFGRPDMNLSFYSAISGLEYMFFDSKFQKEGGFNQKYGKLSLQICEVIEKFNQVGFSLIDITNKMTLCYILKLLDEGNGYFYDPDKVTNPKEMEIDYEAVTNYIQHEKYFDPSQKTNDDEKMQDEDDDGY
ncbi:UNKNOWN [Stylonychia lemnae]|uniref:GPN-loop GTPase 2 n=1 Tax=Stylonychia lemnae TaxID=5949 RepID=A0A078AFS1_STYLE|nr:UNKNOWN [Stylonychia lemnae]|eukprot:CDW81105.1 UNKNOWN [Stylonychia lemnae]